MRAALLIGIGPTRISDDAYAAFARTDEVQGEGRKERLSA